jgi:conjugative relaxase-like TrwC/TraI family protein
VAVAGFTNLGNTAANRSYYEAEVADAAQESERARFAAYYAPSMAARWVSLSGQLVADGAEIRPGDIARAFEGHAPRPFQARDRAARRVETDAIADRLDAPTRKAATDMTISQPKSYSALVELAELAGRAALARDLREARHQVVRDVVRHALDIGLVQTRRGHGGRETETPADVMVAIVPHSKSRAGDPQEHDHVLLFNGSLREDGTVGTLDLPRLVAHKFYLQALVAAGMADRMQRLGFAVTESGRGRWELAGAPEELLRAWSTRQAEVVAGLRGTAAVVARTQLDAEADTAAPDAGEAGQDGGVPTLARRATQARREAKQAVALKSRRAKDTLPDATALAARHREDLARLGLTPEGVIGAMHAVAPLTPVPEGEPAEVAAAKLFERTSVATMRQFRTAVAEAAAVRGMTVAVVDAEVRRALGTGAVKAIGVAPTGEAVLSTDRAIATERAMLVAAREGRGQGRLTAAAAERAIAEVEAGERAEGRAEFAFAGEQRRAVLWAARGDQVAVLEGLAGTGKTTSMRAVVRAAQALGMRTVGVAPANVAAETLGVQTGADEHLSLQGLARQIATGRRVLTARDYILVDEAGMAELAHVATVVRAARAAGAQVALVGDERQFAPIGAGAPFAALGSVLGSSRLVEIRRQRVAWQNAASRRMATGDAEAGILAYAAEGRWTFGRDRADAMARLERDWETDLDRSAGPGGSLRPASSWRGGTGRCTRSTPRCGGS